MRVLLIAPQPPSRGVLQGLVPHGVEPVVAQTRGTSGTEGMVRYEHVAGRGDPVDPMDLRWSRKAMRTLVRDLRPDLVHVIADPWTPSAESGAAAARHVEIPYAIVGTSAIGGARGLAARWQANRIRDEAAGLAGVTKPALDLLATGAPAGARAVLPQVGFEIPHHPPPRSLNGSATFGVVGRIVPERGLDLLLEALAQVRGDWRLRIVGSGPAQEALEGQAQRLGLSARITWMGGIPRQDLAAQWAELDAIVAPSRSTPTWIEPSGSIPLEAMAHGVPAVVSRSGALPDVVGDAGMVVDEGDITALARGLSRLVEDVDFRDQLGTRARQRVLEHYGDGPVAERTARFWKAVRPDATG